MSALGHEQTSRHVRLMSVIPPKADIRGEWRVRLVPEADMANTPVCPGLALSSSETSIGTTTHKRQQDRPPPDLALPISMTPALPLPNEKEVAMPRYQFLNIETFHLIIADTKDAARQLALNEAAIVDATRDADFGSPSKIVVEDRIYEVLPLLS
jgi:hypothetical protein